LTRKPPDLRELLGEDVPAAELKRLGRVHELLVRAGPPPDLPGELTDAPDVGGTVALLPKRHWRPLAALAAALALAAFGAGWLAASNRDSGGNTFPAVDFRVPMQGTAAAPNAVASIAVAERDEAGNWPLAMAVRGLPELPDGQEYELWLTKGGKLAALCGTFRAQANTVTYLNAPYRLRRYDGWVVTRAGAERFLLKTTKV
jgi:anti-sigma-K factor RskA